MGQRVTLAELSIRRPVFAWVLMGALIFFGFFAFRGMGISQLPDVDFPVISIALTYSGAAPEVMESSVVDPIEDSVMGIEGVRQVTSSSQQGAATITVEFELTRNISDALNDVQAKVSQAQRNLPTDLNPPILTKTNPDDQPIIWLALTSDKMPMHEMSRYVSDRLKGQFATIEGVGDIRLGGYLEPNLRVWVDPARLDKYDLTVTDVVNTIKSEHLEPPAGFLTYGKQDFNVRVLGEADSPKNFGNIFINTRGGQPNFAPIPLNKVVSVEDGTEDVRRIARSNGKVAIGLGILKQRGANAVAVARAIRAKLPDVRATLPQGMALDVRNDTTRFIEDAVHELNLTLLLSALLTAAVCWLFLGSWSATVNVLLAIPTSVVGSFMVLYALGFTLNTFTLLALSLSIGIVVDDAIMVLENIVRHREAGESKVKAALFGTRQITFAAVAATFSILAIFLPVAFMKGIIGRFFFQFGVTLAVAVLLSLLEALTLTPMRCASFLDVEERTTRLGKFVERSFEGSKNLYTKALAVALRHRLIVIAMALLIFAGSLLTAKALRSEFLPDEDQGQFLVRITTENGSSLETTSKVFEQAEKWLLARPEVEGTFAVIGGSTGGQVNTGFAFVHMKPLDQRKLSQSGLMALARKQFNQNHGTRAVVQSLAARGFSSSRGFPVEFTVQGPDWNELVKQVGIIRQELGKTGMVTDVDMDYQGQAPEVDIVPNRQRAEARGVSVHGVADTISAAVGGLRVAKFTEQGRRYDIRVEQTQTPEQMALPPAERLKSLYAPNNRGENVPLLQLVDIQQKSAPINLTRLNRQRAITVFANVASGKSQDLALKTAQDIGARVLPKGYALKISGTAQTFQESFQSLIVALVLGIAVAYMILATQFNSFADPVTVLIALPFSLTGAFFGLMIGGQSLNLYSMIGLILLMGIVKKNSILLVDFSNQVRAEKPDLPVSEALIQACPVRLRPILMTSIAQVVGAIPAALAFGPGAESRRPMSIAVIGGVTLSTFLTLFVVPCVYTFLSHKQRSHEEIDQAIAEEQVKAHPQGSQPALISHNPMPPAKSLLQPG